MILKMVRQFLIVAALCLVSQGARAASATGGDKPWLIPPYVLEFNGALLHLFGTNTGFGARVSIEQPDDPKGVKPATGLLLYRNADTIFEPDSAPIQATRKNKKEHKGDFGLMVITLQTQKVSYVISEGVSGYTVVPLSEQATAPMTVQEERLGRENVAGQDCEKLVVAIVPSKGTAQSFVVWRAPRLRGFPVKIQRRLGGPPLIFTFSNIRFESPAAALFVAPESGYTRYDTLNAMTDEMTRRVWNVMQRPDHSIAFPPGTARPPAPPDGGRPY